MMLTASAIREEIEKGNIVITPFNEEQLNPNSYNLKLADELLIYDMHYAPMMITNFARMAVPAMYVPDHPIDMFNETPTRKITIPKEGFTLYPGIVYLARTVEFTETHNLIPCIDGRSSIGRLGINVHATAGFGDVGFKGTWTLEISVTQPVTIYPDIEICQIYYQDIRGSVDREYNGKYQDQVDATASRMYQEFA